MKPTVLLSLVLLASACATSGTRSDRPDPELITRAEIMEVEASNLYEVVQRLRPLWLNAARRSGERSFGHVPTGVVVYQNQTFLGDAGILADWSPTAAYSLEWLDGAKASASLPGLGSRHVAGAIIIRTAPPGE